MFWSPNSQSLAFFADRQLKRIDLVSPEDGRVFQRNVNTVGGVVQAGEPIMLIVPEADELTVEAKIPPQNIDQLMLGQPALLRFAAFNQRTTPEINGTVTRIGADLTQDAKTGVAFYVVRITMPKEEVARLNCLKLIPGMPVEAFVQTGERTMLSYFMKPLNDQLMRVFRQN